MSYKIIEAAFVCTLLANTSLFAMQEENQQDVIKKQHPRECPKVIQQKIFEYDIPVERLLMLAKQVKKQKENKIEILACDAITQALVNKGDYYFNTGRYCTAAKCYETVLSLDQEKLSDNLIQIYSLGNVITGVNLPSPNRLQELITLAAEIEEKNCMSSMQLFNLGASYRNGLQRLVNQQWNFVCPVDKLKAFHFYYRAWKNGENKIMIPIKTMYEGNEVDVNNIKLTQIYKEFVQAEN